MNPEFALPESKWDVNQYLEFDQPLAPDDPRWVDTAEARGEFSFDPLYRRLGVDESSWRLRGAPSKAYILFCGHRGCGKSTELRRVHQRLHSPDIFFSVLLDAASALDPNNLQYQDVLFALAGELLAKLPPAISIEEVHLHKLEQWFKTRILTSDFQETVSAEVEAGGEIGTGIPWLASLFARFTTAFRVNATYKDELRIVVRNNFSEFADAFNQLIAAVEKACQEEGVGQRVLFLVDGTDRLTGEDADSFFLRDVHQLQAVDALFVYTAPIHLVHTGTDLNQTFTDVFKLPMVKLYDLEQRRNESGFEAMRQLLERRAPLDLFDTPATAELLIEHSGGHPRDLLRLLQYTFENADGDYFDREAAERAVAHLATDYRYFLEAGDYDLLAEIDRSPQSEHNSERVRHLLYNLALLEYNAFFWRSHPVVRTLEAYPGSELLQSADGKP